MRRSTRAPRGARFRAGAFVVVAFVALGACAAQPVSEASGEPPTAGPTASPGAESPAVASAAATSVDLDATLFDSGFLIHLTGAAIEENGSMVRVTGDYTSQSHDLSTVDALHAVIEWHGSVLPLLPSGQTLADAGATVTADFSGQVPDGFTLDAATFVIGAPGDRQSRVGLAPGAAPETQLPRPFPVSGSVDVGDLISVEISQGEVVPATCDGSPGTFVLRPAKPDEESLLLTLTVASRHNPFGTNPTGTLITPQGPGIEHDAVSLLVNADDAVRDTIICHTVAAPASGHYVSHWEARRDATEAYLSGDIGFDVPAP